ncbi:hypothetical protein GCM10009872_14570 [Actinopolymorpha rutila]
MFGVAVKVRLSAPGGAVFRTDAEAGAVADPTNASTPVAHAATSATG